MTDDTRPLARRAAEPSGRDDSTGVERGALGRRPVLAGTAAILGASVAGCLGGTGQSLDEPAAVPEDATCAVCNMKPAEYPDWNAQLAFDDGERFHFCSPGCGTAFYADPGRFAEGRSRDAIEGIWFRDYGSTELTDGTAASFVLEMNADRIDAPMMKNPVPFADRADAVAYVEQYDDLGEDDVVGLDAFDVELAKQFRGRFFED